MNKIFNKRGAGTAVMFFTFFALMLLIAAGIFWGVNLLYGRGYDFREAEAIMLREQAESCIGRTGNINAESLEGFDFYKECRLSKKILEDGKHMVLVKAKDDSYKKAWGIADFENSCDFVGGKSNIDFPVCARSELIIGGAEVIVIAASSQHSTRIRV